MCGIVGFIDYTNSLNNNTLLKMSKVITHRGPNDSGQKIWSHTNVTVGFGQVRLSILDLSSLGHQPMSYEKLTITYNGEVYNFKEIKQELIELGYRFISDSDTEVILKSFHAWREKCVQKFIGMFAFAIYDDNDKKVFIFRDRVGVKPLYIYQSKGLILFASELKSFLQVPSFKKEIDIESVSLFLQYNYITNNKSIYKNTIKLNPGSFMSIDTINNSIVQKNYWQAEDFYKSHKVNHSIDEVVNNVENLLVSASKYRMISDVPVGVFLSGGYDSSTLAALLQKNTSQKLKTFTIGFHEEKYNEAQYAKEIAKHIGTEHHEYYISEDDALAIVPKLCDIYDEPFSDTSAIPTVLLSEMTKEKVSVVLSADGGDEVFAGYGRYLSAPDKIHKIRTIPKQLRSIVYKTSQFLNIDKLNLDNYIYNFNSRSQKVLDLLNSDSALNIINVYDQNFSNYDMKVLLKGKLNSIPSRYKELNKLNSINELDKMLLFDYKTFLPDDVLVKVDRATMSVGLEGREPFLDHRILEYAATLPFNIKTEEGSLKYILKTIAHKHIPKHLLDRPKTGFSAPITSWLRTSLKEQLIDFVNPISLKESNIFDIDMVMHLRDDLLDGKRVHPQKLWQIFVYQQWYDRWMK